MDHIVECVPNFSEGRNRATVQAILDAVTSTSDVVYLDHSMDPDHHRAVLTFCGTPEAVVEAAFRAIRTAANLIDLRSHAGMHPRVGATDVVPFIPIKGTTMEDCVRLAARLGEQVGRELEIPVFLYERAATRADHAPLEAIRRGGLAGLASRMASDPNWTPDFGPSRLHRSAGAIVIGARPPLIAYNVNLRSTEVDKARSIARAVRHSNGGLPHVKAIGVELPSLRIVQVAMNLTDYRTTPILTAFQAVQAEAAQLGIEVAGSELIGLIPQAALHHTATTALQLDRFDASQVLETRISEMLHCKTAPEQTVAEFLTAVADSKPTPAGGSVAALVGALAASLGVMGARLSRQPDAEQRLLALSRNLHELVQADAVAYTGLMEAYKLPKDEPERAQTISVALQRATEIPLQIVEFTCEVAQLLQTIREAAKLPVRSDLTVGLTLAIAAGQAGLGTVNTNITSQQNHILIDKFQGRITKVTEILEELKVLC
jgi:glutamate formiminotransferase / formiminotetrahydrofolate cyclodeaminase